ncbi:GNAT family N-acetyltransferase [Roseisalinus antarcticus]|uniref:Putative acetyltransferase n=1 Tax=Roseisalinus antarcticus TaxID=254357 RepID=A0A1Y5TBJ4_9RHOB|nr:GNAT family N-acetyltransferase [Roseisalinus antarcticus]SLN58133.1 putative acetyltransferase [Roseisalinus antarcticus]
MTPGLLTALIDATWPAARVDTVGPWTIRTGAGGGSRVSAASARRPAATEALPRAEAAMRARDQTPLFMVRAGETALDAQLAGRGYAIKDPVTAYMLPAAPTAEVSEVEERWPPLPAQEAIWRAGGIGPSRLDIMGRVSGPRTSLLGRIDGKPAATAFVATAGEVAMLHALETADPFRRKGLGRAMVQAAVAWAHEQGAGTLAILVTTANTPANSLYASLGGQRSTGYHYRILQDA